MAISLLFARKTNSIGGQQGYLLLGGLVVRLAVMQLHVSRIDRNIDTGELDPKEIFAVVFFPFFVHCARSTRLSLYFIFTPHYCVSACVFTKLHLAL